MAWSSFWDMGSDVGEVGVGELWGVRARGSNCLHRVRADYIELPSFVSDSRDWVARARLAREARQHAADAPLGRPMVGSVRCQRSVRTGN